MTKGKKKTDPTDCGFRLFLLGSPRRRTNGRKWMPGCAEGFRTPASKLTCFNMSPPSALLLSPPPPPEVRFSHCWSRQDSLCLSAPLADYLSSFAPAINHHRKKEAKRTRARSKKLRDFESAGLVATGVLIYGVLLLRQTILLDVHWNTSWSRPSPRTGQGKKGFSIKHYRLQAVESIS